MAWHRSFSKRVTTSHPIAATAHIHLPHIIRSFCLPHLVRLVSSCKFSPGACVCELKIKRAHTHTPFAHFDLVRFVSRLQHRVQVAAAAVATLKFLFFSLAPHLAILNESERQPGLFIRANIIECFVAEWCIWKRITIKAF